MSGRWPTEQAAWEARQKEQPTPSKVPDRVIDSRADRLNRYLLNPNDHLLDKSPYGDLVMFTEVAAAIRVLEGKLARLEAEQQDARRVGLEFALHLATETADWCIEEQEKGYLGAMRVADAIKKELSKPTAAKQGEQTHATER